MKVIAIDRPGRAVILEATPNEVAQILGFRDAYELDRSGMAVLTDGEIDVANIAKAAFEVRDQAKHLRNLLREYRARVGELERAIAFIESRSAAGGSEPL